MVISGTYLERLLYNILPYVVLNSFIVFYIKTTIEGKKFDVVFYSSFCIAFTLLIWIIDSIKIHLNEFSKLTLENSLYFDNDQVDIQNIMTIKRVKKGGRWTVKFIEFSIKKDADIYELSVLEKPVNLFQSFKGQSSTLKSLFDRFPELKEKLI